MKKVQTKVKKEDEWAGGQYYGSSHERLTSDIQSPEIHNPHTSSYSALILALLMNFILLITHSLRLYYK